MAASLSSAGEAPVGGDAHKTLKAAMRGAWSLLSRCGASSMAER
jgi:hypothetical protein